MSGAATAQWKIPKHQLDVAERQAQILRCPIENVDIMMECLKSVNIPNFNHFAIYSAHMTHFLETGTRIRE